MSKRVANNFHSVFSRSSYFLIPLLVFLIHISYSSIGFIHIAARFTPLLTPRPNHNAPTLTAPRHLRAAPMTKCANMKKRCIYSVGVDFCLDLCKCSGSGSVLEFQSRAPLTGVETPLKYLDLPTWFLSRMIDPERLVPGKHTSTI